jgi:RNA 2',3'-cyclic 3'-phosphodiesterase
MIRLFVALNIPEIIKYQLIQLRDSVAGSNYKWEATEKLHLTLKFIGDVSEVNLNTIKSELDFLDNYTSLKCSINDFGFFYRDNKPSILWAGLVIEKSVFEIVVRIESALEKFSIKKENRRFNPHLTLLRIKNDPGKNFVNSFKNFTFEPLNFTANSISLFKSELHPNGSKYFEIKNYKLKELEK